ncbi:MAG: transporter substrate-binding domain-containing protein [Paraglaciecola sp.]|nr:transporter substrate-binding domain-containing protein [Paraglaciecola sp.]
MQISALVIFVTLFYSARLQAKEKITVAFGEILAPWVLADTNTGIIIDIFDSAMTPLGYEIEKIYLPYARRSKAYKNGTVDVVSDMNSNTIEKYQLQGYMSEVAYTYQNYAFSLSKRHVQLTQLSDLEKYSLLSWQDATVHLGADYALMAKNNPRYSETFDQSMQVKMLFLERFDVVQMDATIFDYYRANIAATNNIDMTQKVDRQAIFGASPNGFMFKSEKMRDEFDRRLRHLKANGQYHAIFERYVRNY